MIAFLLLVAAFTVDPGLALLMAVIVIPIVFVVSYALAIIYVTCRMLLGVMWRIITIV